MNISLILILVVVGLVISDTALEDMEECITLRSVELSKEELNGLKVQYEGEYHLKLECYKYKVCFITSVICKQVP